jgi:hypothetical protein
MYMESIDKDATDIIRLLEGTGASLDGQRYIISEVLKEIDRKQCEQVSIAQTIWLSNRPGNNNG